MEQFDALVHRPLERLAAADEAHAAGPLVDDGRCDGVGQVGGAVRLAAGIYQADTSHVAVGHLIAAQVDRMVGREFGVHLVVGLAEAEAIEKKAEAQKKMGEASVLEMYLTALPEVVRNAAAPLAQTDKIIMYGDGNSSKLVKDVMNSSNQIIEGLTEATGVDMKSLIAGFVGGKAAGGSKPTPPEA